MEILVFSSVILAAILHAGWNFLVKASANKQTSMTAVVFGHVPAALVCLTVAPRPELASLPYIGAGAVLHVGYQLFLSRAYQLADFSMVYPIARGMAPLLIAVFSWLVLDIPLGGIGTVAVVSIAAGLAGLAVAGGSGAASWSLDAISAALLTGVFIASYSLIDGLGAVHAATALGFYAWLSLLNAALMMVFMLGKNPRILTDILQDGKLPFAVGGSMSFTAYALVIWAFTMAPIAIVSAVRETSIIFGLLAGRWLLSERVGKAQFVSVFLIAGGAALTRLS